MQFAVELEKMKSIYRVSKVIGANRQENDSEHSWHVSVMAMIFADYVDFPIDVSRVVSMLLIHDLVEIDAGDTYCYDEEGNETKLARELKAADRIFALPRPAVGKEFRELWEEFEVGESDDAKYANAIDRLQPFFSNYWHRGEPWLENKITKAQVLWRMDPVRIASKRLWSMVTEMIDEAESWGCFSHHEEESCIN